MTSTTETTIVGAGLAGLSLADSLVDRGVDPAALTVVDDADPRRGSSSPAIMLHPFPGRRMDLRRGQGEAFVRGWERLGRWDERIDGDWWQILPMVRPLTDDDRGAQLKQSWQEARGDYPELIDVQLMDPGEVAEQFPGVEPSTPSLVYRPAAAVMLPMLLQKLRGRLESRGVQFVDARMEKMAPDAGGWALSLSDGSSVRAGRLVLAVGASLDEYFPGLDLRRKGGEVAIFDPGDRQLPALVNASKHLQQRPDGMWGLGSTYFRVDEWNSRDDEAVVEELVGGITDVVPAVADTEVVQVWRGERGVFGSDHMPLVGPVPNEPGLFTFAAFGSKGLLWAMAAAGDLAAELTGEPDAISPHMHTGRMKPEKWRLA